MPFPNEHAARQRDPKDFARIVQLWSDKGVRALGGPLKSNPGGPTVVQTIRFNKSKWTVADAKKWLKGHKYHTNVEAAAGESLSLAIDVDDHLFNKDVIRAGNFIDPKNRQPFTITRERMDQWERGFAAMQANGINVPIYHEHDRTRPLGNVVHMGRTDDIFEALHRFADTQSEELAMRAGYASIKTEPNYVDCEGREYGEVITHIAVTSEPVITRQGSFERVLCLSRVTNQQGDDVMFEWLKEKLGLSSNATEEDVKRKLDEVTKPAPAAPAAPVVAPVAPVVASRADEANLQLARDAREAIAFAAEDRFKMLVNDGKLSASRAKALQTLLVGAPDNRNELCLSRNGNDKPLVLSLLEVFATDDKPVVSGPKSGGQIPDNSMELNRGGAPAEDKKAKAKEALDSVLNA